VSELKFASKTVFELQAVESRSNPATAPQRRVVRNLSDAATLAGCLMLVRFCIRSLTQSAFVLSFIMHLLVRTALG
jgi:hypothetical protein